MDIYTANQSTGKIERISDGKIKFIVQNLKIDDLAIDAINDKIFWSQVGRPYAAIYCSKLDGTEITTVIHDTTMDGVRAIALDRSSQKIYYAIDKIGPNGNLLYHIRRCDYTGQNDILIHMNTTVCTPSALALGGGYLFWCDSRGLFEGYVTRCNMDGSGLKVILSTSGYIKALHVYGACIYVGGSGVMARADFDGGNEVFFKIKGLSIVKDIVAHGADLYILDVGTKSIIKTDLLGDGREKIYQDLYYRSAICLAN